ncbi:MAG: hypothetical protein ASARMPRED_001565 [Alectoria sarmentosa]|nr:MAG: hypothetical protein ASARMPRED_001565 [Alectoria sarmentosa]
MANIRLLQSFQKLLDQPGIAQSLRPPSRPPPLDVDALIAAATSQLQEIEDELWLLQTEPSFFLDQATLVEKNWYDTRPGFQGFDDSTKYCNIALNVSYQRFSKTRSWRWLLEELHNVKKEHDKLSVEVRTAKALPAEYQLALSCLDSTLFTNLKDGSRVDLREYIGIAPTFQKYWTFAQEPGNPKRYTADMKERGRLDVLFEKDRLMWCLYLVTLAPSEQAYDDIPLVLRHLDDYLDKCSRAEAGRINSVMYRFVSELTVLHQINSALEPYGRFYPKMERSFMEISDRPLWRFCSRVPDEPKLFRKPRWWAVAIRPLDKFKMPTGKRDEAWLSKATSVRIVLAKLWRKLREDLTVIWKQAGHLEADMERMRAMLSQYETTEQTSRWAAEKQHIISAAKSKRWTDHEPLVWEPTVDTETLDDKPTTEALEGSSSQDEPQAQEEELTTEAFSDMSIQGRDQSSATYRRPAPTIAGLQTTAQREKSPTRRRYVITKQSLNVIRLMFPSGRQDRGTVDWADFVSLLSEMGFVEVRRAGSARTFKSNNRSITFHKPHPSTDMGSVMLWRVGTRLSKRFDWNRDDFGQAE